MPSTTQLLEQAQRCLKQKAFANAQSKAHSVVKLEPNNSAAWHILGLISIEENNFQEAIGFFKKAVASSPKAIYYFNLGVAFRRLGQIESAIEAYRASVELEPGMVRAWGNLGNAYRSVNDYEKALACYKKCIELEPSNSIVHYNMGILYQLGEHIDEAIKAYRRAVKYNPDNAKAYCNLGTLYAKLRRFQKAISYYKQAIEIDPYLFDGYNNYGSALIELGQTDKAQSYLRKALKLNPASATTLRSITLCKTYSQIDDADAQYIRKLLEDPNLSEHHRMHLYFGLGKIYKDANSPEKAFYYYQKANAIHYKLHPFNIYSLLDYTKSIMSMFDQNFIHLNQNKQSPKLTPLVIVGQPRSGKSLLEQILKTHPEIGGGGEVGLAEFVQIRAQQGKNQPYPEWCMTITEDDVVSIVEQYENKMMLDTPMKQYLIDTMPGNAYYCGLFAILFPEVKIIYMDRDPKDVCLAMFFKYFANKHYYSYQLKTLGEYARVFEMMMSHWQKVLGNQILKVNYEDLVKQPKTVVKKVCKFLQIENECQLPTDIYHEEVGLHRPYQQFLEPLEKGLTFDPTTNRNQVIETLKLASQKHQNKAYEEAAKLYRYVLTISPDNPIAIHLLGVVAFETHREEKAIELIKQAIELNPDYMQAHQNLAIIYRHMGDETNATIHEKIAADISHRIYTQRNKTLTNAHRDMLISVLNKPLKIVKEHERKMLLEGIGSSQESPSMMTRSWDWYFKDLSYGSYRLGGTLEEPLWRLRTWHYLFKNLAVIKQLFNHEKDTLKILDVGCAKAFFRRFVEGNVSPDDDKQLFYWGVDVRRDMLESALTDTTHVSSGAAGNFMPSAYLAHDVANGLPFRDESFDVTVCFEVLKYLPIHVGMQLLYEMHRTLSANGMLYLSTTFDKTQKSYMASMPFDELKQILIGKGFILLGEYGAQAMPEPILDLASKDNPDMVEKLCRYHPPGMVAAMLTPLYPQASTTRVFHLMKGEE